MGTATWIGLEEMKKELGTMSKRLRFLTKDRKWIAIASALVFDDIIDHFQKEEGPKARWARWSDRYRKHMSKIGKGGNKILQDTGRLRQSFKPTNFRKVKDGVLWFNNAKTKTGFPYAYAHDNDERPRRQLPQRKFMWFSPKGFKKLNQQTTSYVLRGKKK